MNTREEQRRQALYRFSDDAITPGNFDLLDELVAPGYVTRGPMGELDLKSLKALMIPLRAALAGFQMRRDLVIVDGDFAATRTTIRGKFERDFHSPNGLVPANGKPFELQFINVFRFDSDGKIADEWIQYDNLSFMTQLGVMQSASAGN
jgi:predicted ester cyclase